jgi:hypothetical protein
MQRLFAAGGKRIGCYVGKQTRLLATGGASPRAAQSLWPRLHAARCRPRLWPGSGFAFRAGALAASNLVAVYYHRPEQGAEIVGGP